MTDLFTVLSSRKVLITSEHHYRSYLNLPIKGCPNLSLNVFDAKDELFGGFGVEIPT